MQTITSLQNSFRIGRQMDIFHFRDFANSDRARTLALVYGSDGPDVLAHKRHQLLVLVLVWS
jgi:hypothetical protein